MNVVFCFIIYSICFCSCLKTYASNRWIVITSIYYPTQAVQLLASLSGWKVVVVADKKTPPDWSCPGCVLLTLEDQRQLGYKTYDYIPFNHYARKNIGYLYAISQGAEVIYDTDDDNIPLNGDLNYLPSTYSGLMIKTKNFFCNIYSHFGQPTVWPRGFPIENVLNSSVSETVFIGHYPLIQQALVNGDPDVDAIFRLTRNLNINFSNQPSSLSLSPQTMCPFNSQSTFFHKDAFWGLLIPVSTKFRVCDIWRGYITQRLLWDIEGSLAFLPPQAIQERNDHNLLIDFIDELDLYIKSKKLAMSLIDWKGTDQALKERFIDLVQYLIQQKFYEPIELELLKAWMFDLNKIGYKMPLLEHQENVFFK